MAGEILKPVVPSLVGDDPFAPLLSRAFLLTEGAGAPVDAVTGLSATPSGTPAAAWGDSPYGWARAYLSGSSQYDDLGQWPELNGAQQITLWCVMRRASVGARMDFLRGTSLSNIFGIQLYSDGTAVFIVAGTSVDRGTVGLGDAEWHVFHLVYDGTQAAPARLRGYIDGVPQGLSPSGTIPSSIPTVAASMRAASYEGDGSLSNGGLAGAGLFLGALSSGEVAEHAADPFRPFRTPLFRASLFRVPSITPPPTAVIWSGASPSGPRVERTDVITIDANPAVFGDDVTDLALEIDGDLVTLPTPTAINVGGLRGAYRLRFVFGRTYTYTWYATVESGTTNTYTGSFTVRDGDESMPEQVRVRVPFGAIRSEGVRIPVVERVLAKSEAVRIVVSYDKAIRSEAVSIRAVDGLPPGYYRSEKAQVLVGRRVDQDLVHYAFEVGDPYHSAYTLAETVEGLETDELRLAEDVIAARTSLELRLAEETQYPDRTELREAVEAGPAIHTGLSLAESTLGGTGVTEGNVVQRSERRERQES